MVEAAPSAGKCQPSIDMNKIDTATSTNHSHVMTVPLFLQMSSFGFEMAPDVV